MQRVGEDVDIAHRATGRARRRTRSTRRGRRKCAAGHDVPAPPRLGQAAARRSTDAAARLLGQFGAAAGRRVDRHGDEREHVSRSSTARPGFGRAIGAGDAARDRRPCPRRPPRSTPCRARSRARSSRPLALARASRRLGQRRDEARDIGRAGAGDRADGGKPASSASTAQSRAPRSSLTCRAATSASSLNSAITPRRIATGRLGMARTIGARRGSAARSVEASTPASNDRITVPPSANGAARGATSSSFCGLKPRITNLGGASGVGERGDRAHALDRRAARPDGDGAATVDPPSASPSTIAPAMLPQPTSQVARESAARRSRFAVGVDQRRGRSPRPATCRPTGRTGTPG